MHLSRVIWKCRKGIREIDILLTRYTEKVYPTLTSQQQELYVEFIDLDTYEILDMLFISTSIWVNRVSGELLWRSEGVDH